MKTLNCCTLGEMCEFLLDGEPCFVIRAKDVIAKDVIGTYIEKSYQAGGKNTIRAGHHLERIIAWQKLNPDKVKVPD